MNKRTSGEFVCFFSFFPLFFSGRSISFEKTAEKKGNANLPMVMEAMVVFLRSIGLSGDSIDGSVEYVLYLSLITQHRIGGPESK